MLDSPTHRALSRHNSRPRSLISWLTATLMLCGALVAGGASSAHAASTPITAATLDWGIKESFRNYVVGSIAHGSIDVSDGATRNSDDTFQFSNGQGAYDDEGRLTKIAFEGTVTFRGHDGQLELHVNDPRVDLNGDQSTLRADMTSKDMNTGQVIDYPNALVGNLDAQAGKYAAADGQSTWSAIPATLAAAGAPAFAGFYVAGTTIDPVNITYSGPGGKPVITTETWDAQNQPSFALTSADMTGFGPGAGSYDAEHDWLWLPSYGGKSVKAIDAKTLETKVTVAIPDQQPRRVVYSAKDKRAYVVDTKVTVLGEGADGAWGVLQQLPAPAASGASNNVDVDPATGDVWLSWSIDARALRIFSLQDDGTYTHRDITTPEEFYPGKVYFGTNGSKVVIGDSNRYNPVGAYRLTGSAGNENFEAIPGTSAAAGYALLEDDTLVFVAADYSNYPVVTTSIKQWKPSGDGYAESDPWLADAPDIAGAAVSAFNADGSIFAGVSFNYRALRVSVDGVFGKPRDFGTTLAGTTVTDDGAVLVIANNSKVYRLQLTGKAPALSTEPDDATVALATGQADKKVTFEANATAGASLRWQVKAPGATRFSDVAGETGESFALTTGIAGNGTQVRVIAKNDFGEIVSKVATVDVTATPTITSPPRSVTVTEGTPAVFTTSFTGLPAPSLTWEREIAGFWQPISSDDENFVLDENSLMIADTTVAQSGTKFRARVRNDLGTARSATLTLKVEPKVVIDPEGLNLTGVGMDWEGSSELQVAPPFGGSNYFSAGTSFGDQATYHATEGDVSIVHVAGDGSETTPTYISRGAHVASGSKQVVRLSEGDATIAPDGSAVVTWEGAWSVNFYGGLVPFTLSDPVLRVDSDGTGTLETDLAGFASSMADPSQREPLDPVPDVTVATFEGVEIDPAGRITIQPDYAGVELDVPADQQPQNRTVAGWGSWPQSFVDFHFATGLSSYWYSSGGAADPHKAAAAFVVDFTDAEQTGPAVSLASTTSVKLGRSSYRYGSFTTATVKVKAPIVEPTGRVDVWLAGKTVSGTLSRGAVTIDLPNSIKPGTYTVNVDYRGASNVKASSASTTLRVTKATPSISLKLGSSKVTAKQRARARVKVTLPGGANVRPTGQIVIRDGNRIIAVKTLKAGHRGTVTVKLPKLKRGKHYLRATIGATGLHSAKSTTYRSLRVR